jgi:hypothetical protein
MKAASKRGDKKPPDRKLSLYGLSIEDALRAAAKTGRSPLESKKPNRQRKKRTKPTDPKP